MRISKKFPVGGAHLEASLDIFNIFNTNPVLAQNEQIGTTWGRPTSVLAPRVFRVGATVRF